MFPFSYTHRNDTQFGEKILICKHHTSENNLQNHHGKKPLAAATFEKEERRDGATGAAF